MISFHTRLKAPKCLKSILSIITYIYGMNLLRNIFSIPLLVFGLSLTSCFIPRSGDDKILMVPSEFKSIKDAVLHSSDGDTIMIAPGYYKEGNILVNSAILITSEWKAYKIIKPAETHVDGSGRLQTIRI